MKSKVFRSLIAGVLLIAVTVLADPAIAQGHGGGGGGNNPPPPPPPPIEYSVEYVPMPANTTYCTGRVSEVSDGLNTRYLVSGYYAVNNGPNRGYIFDPQTNAFIDMHTLLNLTGTWTTSRCGTISSNGIAIGRVSNGNGARACWFDFLATTPTLHILEDQFPELAGTTHSARDINAQGDILVAVFESAPPNVDLIVNPVTDELIPLVDFQDVFAMNDSRVVIGDGNSMSIGWMDTVRYDAANNIVQTFPALKMSTDINNSGKFCGWTMVTTSKPKSTKRYASRYGTSLEWTSSPVVVASAGSRSLNDQGDVAFLTDGNIPWLHHATLAQSYDVRTLVNETFFDTAGNMFELSITNRDQSLTIPAPIIAGDVTALTGERRVFLLFPIEP